MLESGVVEFVPASLRHDLRSNIEIGKVCARLHRSKKMREVGRKDG
jgi:hypothetical protein